MVSDIIIIMKKEKELEEILKYLVNYLEFKEFKTGEII